MTQFDESAVRKLAQLAHLSLTDEEAKDFAGQLEQILDYAARIQSLETDGIEPTSRALVLEGLDGDTALRPDEPRPSLDRNEVLDGAPDHADGLFKVPKVLP